VAAVAAAPGRELDLDHIGAEVAQHLGRVGAEDHAGHVEDANALQRAGRLWGERMGRGAFRRHRFPPWPFRLAQGSQRAPRGLAWTRAVSSATIKTRKDKTPGRNA